MIGKCVRSKDGKITELEREYFRQGWIFKDEEAFRERPKEPCYVPELSDTVYTGEDILAICRGQKEVAEEIFYALDWQHPESLLEDWIVNGELEICEECGKIFDCYEEKECLCKQLPKDKEEIGGARYRGQGQNDKYQQ